MISQKISERIGTYICDELSYDDEKKELIVYAIENLLLSLGNIVAILVVSSLFDALIPALVAVLFGGTLRKFSGGAHFSSPGKCLAFGTFVYTLIGIIGKNIYKLGFISNNVFLLIILLLCLLIVRSLAPVDSPAKPIHSEIFKKKLKIASVIVVVIAIVSIIIVSSSLIKISIVLGVLYQTITLLPIFNKRR